MIFLHCFDMMQGMQGDPVHAYQSRYEKVYVHGCGTGFHQQLMADASLNLGFSCYSHALCVGKAIGNSHSCAFSMR